MHDVLFPEIKNNGILGMDFLTKHPCYMFLSKKHLLHVFSVVLMLFLLLAAGPRSAIGRAPDS